MKRTEHEDYEERFAACPANQLLATLGQKWAPVTLQALAKGRIRYSGLQRAIPLATQKMLTQTLRQLEQKGLVTRHVFGDKPPLVVEYELSSAGRSLLPLLSELAIWAGAHSSAAAIVLPDETRAQPRTGLGRPGPVVVKPASPR